MPFEGQTNRLLAKFTFTAFSPEMGEVVVGLTVVTKAPFLDYIKTIVWKLMLCDNLKDIEEKKLSTFFGYF